jgi:uncharacterized protein (DUF1501 family)
MLTLSDIRPTRHCQGFSRREFLRVGSLALGGLSLPALLAARADAAVSKADYIRDKSVVVLFLQGGPPHIECFDPKMSAPVEIRSITGEVPTAHPGITFGGTFPQLAKLAKKFSIVRSYASKNAGHEYLDVMSARNAMKATMSAIYAKIAGTNHPTTGMPLNTLVLPEAVNGGLKMKNNFETGALPTLTAAGTLGPSYAAFNPSGGGQLKSDMELKMPAARLDDRRNLLAGLDRIRRSVDASGIIDGLDKYQAQAFEVITRGVAEAFDLSKEDPATIARYDTSHLFTNEEVTRWYDMARSSNQLGKQMLLARRLCEAGCGFVTVSDCGWDFHSNGNSPKHLGGMNWLGPQVDHAVAAFIEDIEARGLRDKVLLVVTGEMGRTPRINNDGGRDHYSELTPLLVYGGGLKMGQVIGQSDRTASRPATEAYEPSHLMATIFHTVFDIGKLRLDSSVPGDIARLIERGEPIRELV